MTSGAKTTLIILAVVAVLALVGTGLYFALSKNTAGASAKKTTPGTNGGGALTDEQKAAANQ